MNDIPGDLAAWQARCKASGLSITTPRRAVLRTLLEQDGMDAVALLQRARTHHAGTSVGTVYRFMRELERLGLAHAKAQAHGRMRWYLGVAPAPAASSSLPDIGRLVAQLREFLRQLEALGFAEANPSSTPTP